MGKTSIPAVARYNKKAYDRIIITVPKGGKDIVKQAVEKHGAASVNSYIVEALNRMLTEDGYPELITDAAKSVTRDINE